MRHKSYFMTIVLPVLAYPAGDAVAQMILGGFNPFRSLALLFTAAFFYSIEIPKWFGMLEKYYPSPLGKTIGAVFYFNPLWIARHMLAIKFGESCFNLSILLKEIPLCLMLGLKSFLANIPISFIGNYIVQVKVPFQYRFLGSVILTGILAIAYAFAYKFF